jgi:capsular polysaccharide biosynthesis protein
MVLVIAAALVAAYLITPRAVRYQSETTLLVGRAPTNLDADSEDTSAGRLTGLSLVSLTYVQMLQSRPVAEDTVRTYNLNVSPENLSNAVTAFPNAGTQLLEVRVVDQDPQTAQLLATGVVESFINLLEEQAEQQEDSNVPTEANALAPVSVYASATLPTTPLDNGLFQNLLLGLLFGAFVAVGVVLVLEYVDLTLRMPEDVERHTGLPVLGVIPMSQELTNRSVIIGAASRFVQSRSQL